MDKKSKERIETLRQLWVDLENAARSDESILVQRCLERAAAEVYNALDFCLRDEKKGE